MKIKDVWCDIHRSSKYYCICAAKQINFAHPLHKTYCHVWINKHVIDEAQLTKHLHRNVNILKYWWYEKYDNIDINNII